MSSDTLLSLLRFHFSSFFFILCLPLYLPISLIRTGCKLFREACWIKVFDCQFYCQACCIIENPSISDYRHDGVLQRHVPSHAKETPLFIALFCSFTFCSYVTDRQGHPQEACMRSVCRHFQFAARKSQFYFKFLIVSMLRQAEKRNKTLKPSVGGRATVSYKGALFLTPFHIRNTSHLTYAVKNKYKSKLMVKTGRCGWNIWWLLNHDKMQLWWLYFKVL